MLQNRETELTAIGMAMSDSHAAEKLAMLPEDTFTFSDTLVIYKGVRSIVEKHGAPDLTTIVVACSGISDMNISITAMEALRLGGVTAANYGQYETILLDLRKRRNLLSACTELASNISNPAQNPDELVSKVVDAISDNADRGEAVEFRDALKSLMATLETKKSGGLSMGIAGLTSLTGGFKPGQLIYLGARPGVGKTAIGLYMMVHIASHSGPVLVDSLEMEPEQLVARVVAEGTGVDVQAIENCNLQPEEYGNIWGQAPVLSEMPMRFCAATTPMQLRREARSMIQNGGLKMIMVDYLQLMRSDQKTGSKYEEVTQISRDLKLMAMELKVPILALTQLNRVSEAGNGQRARKPSMSEARDSGAIEQDANVFLTLYAPDEPKLGSTEHEFWQHCRDEGAEWHVLTVEKNRQGRCGQISLKFDKPHMRFTTLTKGNGQ